MSKLKISGILEQYEKVLEVIHLKDSIVPAGVQQALDEERVKHNGEIWTIHKSDKDPFPSNPHAHNYEKRLKMDLGSGELYNGLKKVGKIDKNSFIAFRAKIRNVTLPELAI